MSSNTLRPPSDFDIARSQALQVHFCAANIVVGRHDQFARLSQRLLRLRRRVPFPRQWETDFDEAEQAFAELLISPDLDQVSLRRGMSGRDGAVCGERRVTSQTDRRT